MAPPACWNTSQNTIDENLCIDVNEEFIGYNFPIHKKKKRKKEKQRRKMGNKILFRVIKSVLKIPRDKRDLKNAEGGELIV